MDAKVKRLEARKSGMKVKTQKIVVIDDDPIILEVSCEILMKHGFETTQFSTGQALLEAIKTDGHTADLYLVDYEMPGMNGLEAMKKAQLIAGVGRLPFALVTSHEEREMVDDAGKTGAVGYINKPFKPGALLAGVRVALLNAAELLFLSTDKEENEYIKIATGILIERYKIHPNEAYEKMRSKARASRCKVHEIAAEIIITTGEQIDVSRKQIEP